MNEAFEQSSRVSSLTCVFPVLFPGAVESLRHLGWEPMVKPGCGPCLPILNGQWQLQLLEWELPQGGVACRAAGVHIATLMERKRTFTQSSQAQQLPSRKNVGGSGRRRWREKLLGFETFCLD